MIEQNPCSGDSCEINYDEIEDSKIGDAIARIKLRRWESKFLGSPMDYDAPGSTVRESGV